MGVATEDLISYQTLRTPKRQDFIKQVLDPLRICLILVGKRFNVDRSNVRFKNTLTLMNIFDEFLELENSGRKEMFQVVFKMFLYKIEVDVYYRDRFGWFVEELIKAVLRGEFEERTNGQPSLPHWKEEGQYGGKYSIIKALQREEIKKVIHTGGLL